MYFTFTDIQKRFPQNSFGSAKFDTTILLQEEINFSSLIYQSTEKCLPSATTCGEKRGTRVKVTVA